MCHKTTIPGSSYVLSYIYLSMLRDALYCCTGGTQCRCHSDDELGYWHGPSCDKCLPGFIPPTCTECAPGKISRSTRVDCSIGMGC